MPSGRFDQLAANELTAGPSAVTARMGFRPVSHRPHGNAEVAK